MLYESDRPYAPASRNLITIRVPFKPQQFPSIVEALIAWQQLRVFYPGNVSLHSVNCFIALRHDDLGRLGINVRHGVGSSSDGLVARLAVPDTNRVSLDGGLSAEGADVSGVLGDFHLLDLLSEGGTVSRIIYKSAL